MSFVGIFVSKSFTFSVSDFTVFQSWSLRKGNVVFFSNMIFLMVSMLYIDLRPVQTCHSKVMHRKEETHSDGSYEKKSCRRAWLKKWDKVKIPWYTHKLMHRKRLTCELHDSYFRLMTIKHAIPKIERAIELLYDSVRQEVS